MVRVFHGLLALALFVSLSCAVVAGPVPAAISYQGKLTNEKGQPIPDGDRPMAFRLYAEELAKDPVWAGEARVTTVGGVFTTFVSPPAEVFQTYGDLWIETAIEGRPLEPRVKLQSVPFAIRAATADRALTADTVPNGSITAIKLAADVIFARAPYLAGIKSGLPSTYSLVVKIDGVATNPPAKLAESYKESIDVVWYQDGEDRILRARPGAFHCTPLVLRRPLSSNKDWLNLAKQTVNGQTTRHTCGLVVMNGTAVVCSWTGNNGFVSGYEVRLADDGLPVEQIRIETEWPLTRTISAQAGQKPIGAGLQLGFTSGQTLTSAYRLKADGVDMLNVVPASDAGFTCDVIEYLDGLERLPRKRPGSARLDQLVVRKNPALGYELHPWWLGVTNGQVERKTVGLSLPSKFGVIPIADLLHTWPCSYTLRVGDDGLPYEEYELAYEEVAAQ